MRENIIKVKSFRFALRVINLYKFLKEEKSEFVMSKQLLRSGTAIGALVRESEQAESTSDFIHELSIALKEANETDYWIKLLYQSDYVSEIEYNSIKIDITEILKLLISIIKSTKENHKK
jgi:four helix bundle protein